MQESLPFGQGTTRIFENCNKYGIPDKGYNYLWSVKVYFNFEFSMRKMLSSYSSQYNQNPSKFS